MHKKPNRCFSQTRQILAAFSLLFLANCTLPLLTKNILDYTTLNEISSAKNVFHQKMEEAAFPYQSSSSCFTLYKSHIRPNTESCLYIWCGVSLFSFALSHKILPTPDPHSHLPFTSRISYLTSPLLSRSVLSRNTFHYASFLFKLNCSTYYSISRHQHTV